MEVFAYALFDQKASTLPLIRSISFQPSNGSYLEEYIPLIYSSSIPLGGEGVWNNIGTFHGHGKNIRN